MKSYKNASVIWLRKKKWEKSACSKSTMVTTLVMMYFLTMIS